MSCAGINPAKLSGVWGNNSPGLHLQSGFGNGGGDFQWIPEANSWLKTHDLEGTLMESILVTVFFLPP